VSVGGFVAGLGRFVAVIEAWRVLLCLCVVLLLLELAELLFDLV